MVNRCGEATIAMQRMYAHAWDKMDYIRQFVEDELVGLVVETHAWQAAVPGSNPNDV